MSLETIQINSATKACVEFAKVRSAREDTAHIQACATPLSTPQIQAHPEVAAEDRIAPPVGISRVEIPEQNPSCHWKTVI